MIADRLKPLALLTLLLVSIAPWTATPAVAAEVEVAEVGEPPPLFTLKDEHGKVHRLEAHFGGPTVV